MKKQGLLLISFLIVNLISLAQNDGKVAAMSFVKEDTIVLRFGASNASLFREGLLKRIQN